MQFAAGLIATWAAHAVILTLIGFVVVRAIAMGPDLRCAVWRVALFAPLVSAPVAAMRPGHLSITDAVSSIGGPTWRMHDVDVQVTNIGGRVTTKRNVKDPAADFIAAAILVATIGLSLLGIMRHSVQQMRTRRRLGSRAQSDVRNGVVLSTSAELAIPCALSSNEICVPASFSLLPDATQHSILLHEQAHIDRNDIMWLYFSRFMSAVAWWHPAVRFANTSLERETELSADRRAVEMGADARALVGGLAHFASLYDSGPVPRTAFVSRRSSLEIRARALLGEAREVYPLRWVAIPAMLLFSAAVCLTTSVSAARSPYRPAGPASSAPGLIETDTRTMQTTGGNLSGGD